MDERSAFQTRARTIDHLGRGQIADCPTAISELWKNAFDAYARTVSLNIFTGDNIVAAVMDDGFGMSKDDFLERWLVIGTESKIEGEEIAKEDMFDLPHRTRQGEKGIGRLSAAFLAPISLVVSKKKGQPFTVALVDWRLFENPFLALHDIKLPVIEFDDTSALLRLLPEMISGLRENLTGDQGSEERRHRIATSWEKFTIIEESEGISPITIERITQSCNHLMLTEEHLNEWTVFKGKAEHGTALFMLDVNRELSVWADPSALMDDDAAEVRERLRETLTAFIDPFSLDEMGFDYKVTVINSGVSEKIISSSDMFGVDDFHELEHFIEGRFDESGMFIGNIRAFGKDRTEFRFAPSRVLPKKGRDYLGPFDFCIGTFEQERNNSTHDEASHQLLLKKASNFGGLPVYRDGLRVMPYGRHDGDFCGINERRSKHAGREFWAHRRSFGRVAFTHLENPNLRDKAGREGLVDNRAMREMRMLIKDLLMQTARRFFGTDSDIRKEELPEIVKQNLAARKAAVKAKKARRRSFRKILRDNKLMMFLALEEIQAFSRNVEKADDQYGAEKLNVMIDMLEQFRKRRESLRLPPLPSKLGDSEEDYRKYRDALNEYSAVLESIGRQLTELTAKVGTEKPEVTAERWLQSNQAKLSNKINQYLKEMDESISTLRDKWRSQADEDRSRYYARAEPVLADLQKGTHLTTVLNMLDTFFQEFSEDFTLKYEPFLRSLGQLLADIDLDGALSVSEWDLSRLQEMVDNLHALAQTGISIEIIGHELETLDAEVTRNLRHLPKEVREGQAYHLAFEAHRALTDRLRFLAPLKIAGYRSRQAITGQQIADYMESFFIKQFTATRTSFIATDAFRKMRITDLPSRIFPVFMNLIHNALYWVTFVSDRRIVLDFVEGKTFIADTGRGVDQDDVPRLFELFFTRRAKGRGVGLYLCRANLAAAHHKIRYAGPEDSKVLNGANFIIEFKGVRNA